MAIYNIPIEQFSQLVARRTGLQIRPQDGRTLQQLITTRIHTLKFTDAAQYHQLLAGATARSQHEWETLIPSLTTGESYFFRDHGQFNLLKNVILPELIARRQEQRSLRLWSAGCSTGEEAYSLAILLDQLLPDRSGWDILVLGTDLNQEAVERARRGVYTAWSFRRVPPELQQRYFRQRQARWELDRHIRDMVAFRVGNLIQDNFPNCASDMHDMDLIVCRNVFIYFGQETLARVVAKFANTIRDEGYLLTGHAELLGQQPDLLQPRIFPGSVIYQHAAEEHSDAKLANTFSFPIRLVTDEGKEPFPPPPAVKAGALFPGQDDVVASTLPVTAPPGDKSDGFAAQYQLAQRYADLGWHEQAVQCCRRAIEANALAIKPYYLLAQIAEDRGDTAVAKEFLKKVIYLAPTAVAAYLDLASLYRREGKIARADKMQATAVDLLKNLPAAAPVEPYPNLTAGELLKQFQ